MSRRLSVALALGLSATAALAFPATAEPVDDLLEALRLESVLEIMREEGLVYADELEAELFPAAGGENWRDSVERLYALPAMMESFRASFAAEMPESSIAPALAYFESEEGQRIIGLEISARIAQMDESIEAASRETLETMQEQGDPRLDLLEAFSEANDLVEANVVGSLNANYAFYTGLVDGGAFAFDLTEDQILADVWQQEPEIRSDTRDWLFSYLALAYQPLSDEEVQSYIDFSETEAGQDLNRALFAGFDTMLVGISRGLGLAAARFMGGQDI
ncbi:hypothetical protein PSA7680_00686 [Pseudoruegeria aquimaris]|uniref:DUF2059 domain-containing protein n=1 Tax=Pseudoruegeria aquimaris TaxID=393663 RepID=A0A1Y5RJL8_9RHOB|nr:hypothetical protein [Pseudoruegeria aquimaris]SLN19146.1 hypothetical protein PSA7680_00686 [Pseudoruegeria aquimaris]